MVLNAVATDRCDWLSYIVNQRRARLQIVDGWMTIFCSCYPTFWSQRIKRLELCYRETRQA